MFCLPYRIAVNLDVHPGDDPDEVVLDHAVGGAEAVAEETRHPHVVQCRLLHRVGKRIRH